MPDGVVLHREQVLGTGTWSPRPAALSGITPVAVLVYGDALAPGTDGVNRDSKAFCIGFSDGTKSSCASNNAIHGLGSTRVGTDASGINLFRYTDKQTNVLQFSLGIASFVSGGLDVSIEENLTNPYLNVIFFYGDDWQAKADCFVPGGVGAPKNFSTGFTGTNENQIVFTLPFFRTSCSNQAPYILGDTSWGFGIACRQGASTTPSGQSAYSTGSRNSVGTTQARSYYFNNRAGAQTLATSYANDIEATAIRDNEVEFTTRDGNTRSYHVLVVSTGSKKVWCGELLAPTANGNWIINGPGFQPVLASVLFTQVSNNTGSLQDVDVASGGLTAGTASVEYCSAHSEEDGVATSNVQTRANNRFLDALQDDGSEGWKAGANDFSLTATGFRVDNVVVDGGGGGAPLTQRYWIGWAVEGVAGPPGPEVLNIDDLTHVHPVDQVDLISSVIALSINDLTHLHPVDSPDVSGNFLLAVPDLTHAHPVDQCAVSEVGANFPLDIDGLFHAHPVDSPQVTPDFLLDIDKLSHAHPVDSPTLTVLVIPLTINDLTHMHPVDQVNVGGGYPLTIMDLTHQHPVDQVAVGAMEGDLTALIGETDRWSANAGVELNNTQGVDLNWHVVEVMFDGVNTSIAVDGVEVKGDAGIRALAALTIGAEMDGSNRFSGNLGELRVYSGAMTGPERLAVRNELTTKWITG